MKTEKEELDENVVLADFAESRKANGTYDVETNRYDQQNLNEDGVYEKPKLNVKKSLKETLKCHPLALLYSLVPLVAWLPKYQWKKNIPYDFLSGVTVAIMHIPQGMAYGILGNVPPITGLYMAFFPVLVYFIFGTSRHVSIGTFAIVCLMTGKVVSNYGHCDQPSLNETAEHVFTNVEVATTVSFSVAILQITMFLFRLGVIANLLSDVLVSGFTCACAFHVVASQMKDLLGIPVRKRHGLFALIMTVYDAVLALPEANKNAVLISLIVIVITVINNEICKPRLAKVTRVPFPIELAAVVLGTTTSHFMDFQGSYNITVLGHIPTGMPNISMPRLDLIPDIIGDVAVITIISYAITISMALIFAQKLHYYVNPNQELLALGGANAVGSFFGCMPVAASLSRSMIQHNVGGVTQLASVVSCLFILVLMMWVGPLFESLPRCILASIIVVALRSMLKQYDKLPKFFKMSKFDGFIWVFTFLSTALISITFGLAASVCLSVLWLFYKGQHPDTCLLGNLIGTDYYLDTSRYQAAVEIPGIKILRYAGSLNYASKAALKGIIYKAVDYGRSKKRTDSMQDTTSKEGTVLFTKCFILDCSALTYVDPAAVEYMNHVLDNLHKIGIEVCLTACSPSVYEMIKNCDKYQSESHYEMFPSIPTAVAYARANIL